MTKKILSLLMLVLFTTSCSIYHVNSIDTTEDFYPAKEFDQVAYLPVVDKVHKVIGVVTVNGERKQRNIDDVIVKMRREAAIIGGDAITDIKTDATGVWKKLPAQDMLSNAYVRANYTASVVVFEGTVPSSQASDTEEDLSTAEEDISTEEDL